MQQLERVHDPFDTWESAGWNYPRETQDHPGQDPERRTGRLLWRQILFGPRWESSLNNPLSGSPPCTASSWISRRHLTAWTGRSLIWKLMQHYGFPPQVHRHHPAAVWRCHLSSHTRGKADQPFPGTDRCTSGLYIVADNISAGGGLDYAAIHRRPEDRHPVDIRQTTRRPWLRGRYHLPLPQTTRCTREARPCCSWGREDRPQDQHREDRDPTHQQQTARPSQTTARGDQGSGQVDIPGQCSEQGRWSRRRYQEPYQQSQTRLQNPHSQKN